MKNIWSFYFLAKLVLYYTGLLKLDWVLNLLLAVFVFWPVGHAIGARVREVIGVVLAVALLYSESPLRATSMEHFRAQIQGIAGFSVPYVMELLARVLNWRMLAIFTVVVLVYAWLARRLRMSALAVCGLLSVPLVSWWQVSQNVNIHTSEPRQIAEVRAESSPNNTGDNFSQQAEAELDLFYIDQYKRRIQWRSPAKDSPRFDLIVLHVCSLSWSDLSVTKQANHPLLRRFDAVFTRFNSAASYSGPAMRRVLTGGCGHTSHKRLYDSLDPQCYVFPSLEQLGYRTQAMLNHDGAYDGFMDTLQKDMRFAGKVQSHQGARQAMKSFDGSPIYDDGNILSQWWAQRQKMDNEAVALYYNSITLHDGNRMPNSNANSLETYPTRLNKLLTDLDKFLSELERSARPVVVMVVSEHGAALDTNHNHIAGLREIPSSDITLVPAAIKVIGLNNKTVSDNKSTNGPVRIDNPTSYFDVYSLVSDILAEGPQGYDPAGLPQRAKNLTQTPFVSENSDILVMQKPSGEFWVRGADRVWLRQ